MCTGLPELTPVDFYEDEAGTIGLQSSNQTMIQIVLGMIIVLIGIFVFYKYPIKNDVKQVTLGALFIILAIILKRLAIMVPFLGLPSLKITLEVLPLIVAGLTLQPGYCYIVAIASDALGLVLANAGGFPFLGFTLNAILQTLIPCMLKMYLTENQEKLLERIVKIGIPVISLLACIYVFSLDTVSISQQEYSVTVPIKLAIFAIIICMLIILFVFMNYYKKKLKEEEGQAFHLCILSVVSIELIVTFFLTPYWLEVMYGIPFFASQFVRILKACVMIPVGIFIVYTMYKVVRRVLKS
ncbi:MAG: folate family ECF transporter S component [Faecalibacillus sp.]